MSLELKLGKDVWCLWLSASSMVQPLRLSIETGPRMRTMAYQKSFGVPSQVNGVMKAVEIIIHMQGVNFKAGTLENSWFKLSPHRIMNVTVFPMVITSMHTDANILGNKYCHSYIREKQ